MICNYKLCHWIQYFLLHLYFTSFSSFPVIFYHLLLFWRENYQLSCLFAFTLHLFDCVILPSIAFATWGLKRGKWSPRWYFKNNLASLHALFSEVAAQSVDDTITPLSSQMWCVPCQQQFLPKTMPSPLNIPLSQILLMLCNMKKKINYCFQSKFVPPNDQFLSILIQCLYRDSPIWASKSTAITIFITEDTTLAVDKLSGPQLHEILGTFFLDIFSRNYSKNYYIKISSVSFT